MTSKSDLNEIQPGDLDFTELESTDEQPGDDGIPDWEEEAGEAPRPEQPSGIPGPMAGPEYGPGPAEYEDPQTREELNAVAFETQACRDCPLGAQRKNAVPGIGPSSAGVLFIGEAPGANEDTTGHPFTGQAGKLLDGLLARAGTNRNRVFITNMLKCRPPDNRDPTPGELSACDRHLNRQVEALQPRLIVPLGKFSTQKFLPGVELKELRSNLYATPDGTLILPVYHPAAALRRKEWRKDLINDFGTIGRIIDGEELEALEPPAPRAPRGKREASAATEDQQREQASLF